MEVAIRPVSYAEIKNAPNFKELFDAYTKECSIEEIGECAPQWDTYSMLEHSLILQCFGVYADGELKGFASLIGTPLPHYGKKVATVESIFVADEPQLGAAGFKLILAIERYCTDAGCVAILYSAPVGSRFDRFLSISPDYRHTNRVYCRRLN